jgi:F-type H+-transporting ATPase subunit delta
MARTSSSARRYADAAFEVAERDGTVDAWRQELALAATTLSEPGLARALANPAVPLELRVELAADAVGPAEGGIVDEIGELLERVGRSLKRDALPDLGSTWSWRRSNRIGARQDLIAPPPAGWIELLPAWRRVRPPRRRAQSRHHANTTSAAPWARRAPRLTARLEQLSGGRVELATDVDPSILGGVVVRLGDRLIDGSVRGRLERLRSKLASGAL